jgi:hypothetical protein
MSDVPPNWIRLRDTCPANRWENRVGHGAYEAVHDPDGTVIVPKDQAQALIKRGGYVVAEYQ